MSIWFPVSSAFRVSPPSDIARGDPQIVGLKDGNFVVAWENWGNTAQTGTGLQQPYNRKGEKIRDAI